MSEKGEKWEGKVKLKVNKATYAVARARNFDDLDYLEYHESLEYLDYLDYLDYLNSPFFALINDGREITIVTEEEKLPKGLEVERGFRLITFETFLPFDTVGFIARISRALAEKNIPILVFSSYSTDHILVKAEDLQKAVEILRELGFE